MNNFIVDTKIEQDWNEVVGKMLYNELHASPNSAKEADEVMAELERVLNLENAEQVA